jgi:2-polyprenyl-6-hydroxyphenyl methylase/3-demethylubiquinone-9 3-methyltransferase
MNAQASTQIPKLQSASTAENSTIDPDEVARFSRIADEWWDENGKFKPLHRINPLRIGTIRDHACAQFGRDASSVNPLQGLRLLDIGCGGGLISEPMARMGTAVTGLDASEKNIAVARLHAEQTGTQLTYTASTAEALAATGAQFDIVLALEIIEHVANIDYFYDAITQLVRPGGMLVMSTLNRTAKSYAMAIIGAEYVLRWLPRGTHSWSKFIRPSEMVAALTARNMAITDLQGMVFDPIKWKFSMHPKDLDVNYMLVAKKQ